LVSYTILEKSQKAYLSRETHQQNLFTIFCPTNIDIFILIEHKIILSTTPSKKQGHTVYHLCRERWGYFFCEKVWRYPNFDFITDNRKWKSVAS
jgi:hypothetical protein